MVNRKSLSPQRVSLPSRMQVQSERDRLIRKEQHLKHLLHAVGLGIGVLLLAMLVLLRFSSLG